MARTAPPNIVVIDCAIPNVDRREFWTLRAAPWIAGSSPAMTTI
jgi:hypothetical protein